MSIRDCFGQAFPDPVIPDSNVLSENYRGLPDEEWHVSTEYMGRQFDIPLRERLLERERIESYDRIMHHNDLGVDIGIGHDVTVEHHDLVTACEIQPEPTWQLSIDDVMSEKYKEMEKRVEEQDKTIAEMKSIIENLQDIVYQKKLDKEAENLIL